MFYVKRRPGPTGRLILLLIRFTTMLTGRMTMRIATGRPVGLLLAITMGGLTAWCVQSATSQYLADWIRRDVFQPSSAASGVQQHYAVPRVLLEHRAGNPWVYRLPMAGHNTNQQSISAQSQWVGVNLLRVYIFQLRSDPDAQANTEVANDQKEASILNADPTLDDATVEVSYENRFLIVEVVQIDAEDSAEICLNVALQQSPGVWRRIPWWEDVNAISNCLMSLERDPVLPFLHIVGFESSLTAFRSFMTDHCQERLKQVNQDYGSTAELTVRPSDFEISVTDQLNRLLSQDFGHLATARSVFLLQTISGTIQTLTLVIFFALLWPVAARAVVFRLVPAAERRLVRRLVRRGSSREEIVQWSVHWNLWRNDLLQERSPLLVALTESTNSRTAAAEQILAARRNVFLAEKEETIIYCGFLGTTLFLALALGAIELSDQFGELATTISAVAKLNAQAFLTTVLASICHRIGRWLHLLEMSGEQREWQYVENCIHDPDGWLASIDSRTATERNTRLRQLAAFTTSFVTMAMQIAAKWSLTIMSDCGAAAHHWCRLSLNQAMLWRSGNGGKSNEAKGERTDFNHGIGDNVEKQH